MSIRIAVTGKHGQVARALTEAGPFLDAVVIPLGRPELDLEAPETIEPALAAAAPDIVVNAAAYTAVDQAELEPEREIREGGGGIKQQADIAARPSDENLFGRIQIKAAGAGLLPIHETGVRAVEQPLIPHLERRWGQWGYQMLGHAAGQRDTREHGVGRTKRREERWSGNVGVHDMMETRVRRGDGIGG